MKTFLLCAVLLMVVGCSLFGVHKDPKTGDLVSDGTGGIVGKVGGTFWPWAGTLIAGLTTAYVEVKRRNWKEATSKTVEVLEDFKGTPAGEKVWKAADGLRERLIRKQPAKVRALIDGLTKPKK